jgi:signal recognition particle GTPase
LIKAHYGPATEDLVEQLSTTLVQADIQNEIAEAVIDGLKDLGYEITIEVEVHGDMAKALESLNDGSAAAGAVSVERPKRKI